jgi:hypothetical protein
MIYLMISRTPLARLGAGSSGPGRTGPKAGICPPALLPEPALMLGGPPGGGMRRGGEGLEAPAPATRLAGGSARSLLSLA